MEASEAAAAAATARAIDMGDLSIHEALHDDEESDEEAGDAAKVAATDKKLTTAAKAAGIKIVGRNGMGWVPNSDRKNCAYLHANCAGAQA